MNSSFDSFIKYFLPLFFFIYQFVLFYFRSYKVYKNTGIKPFVFGRSSSLHDFLGKSFLLVNLLNLTGILIYSFFYRFYNYTYPFLIHEYIYLRLFGFSLLLSSFIFSFIAQLQMGNSWRIGIDKNNLSPLVSTGLFKYSRNPFSLGVLLSLTGIFFILPNILTLLSLVLGFFFMQVQIRLEEEFLTNNIPGYKIYFSKVRRWI